MKFKVELPVSLVNPEAVMVTLLEEEGAVTRSIVSPESTVPCVPELVSSTKAILPAFQLEPVVHELPLLLVQRLTRLPSRAASDLASAKSPIKSFVAVVKRLFNNIVLKLGPAKAAKMATIAITINNSTIVNPCVRRYLIEKPLWDLILMWGGLETEYWGWVGGYKGRVVVR